MKIKIALRANNPRAKEGYPIRGGKYAPKFQKKTYNELEEQVEEFTMKHIMDEKRAEIYAEAEAERRRREKMREDDERFQQYIDNKMC